MSLIAAEARDCLHGGPGLLRAIIAWCQMAAGAYRLMPAVADTFTLVDAAQAFKEEFSIRARRVIGLFVLTKQAKERRPCRESQQLSDPSYLTTVGRLTAKKVAEKSAGYKFRDAACRKSGSPSGPQRED